MVLPMLQLTGHADMPGLFPLVTPAPISLYQQACGMAEWDGAPWQWWDNTTYDMMAGAYHGQPGYVMGCLALLSNPDMSEEKGMAFTDMLEELHLVLLPFRIRTKKIC